MIAELKPYPEMRDSGVPWLGQVPSHWEVTKLGTLLRERGENNRDDTVTDVLSVVKDRGVIPYADKGNVGNKKSDDIGRYKIVRPGDIVVNCMNVIIGSVGLSKYLGCLSPVYYVLTTRSSADSPAYLNAYFQTKPFQQSLVRIGNGILAHRMRIPMELFKGEAFPRPPLPEQEAIVRFLDYADRRIRRYIRAKQRLIKLLEEQKQAIIHRAVTRGLNPDVRLKPSGVEWLRDIPEHWEAFKLGQLLISGPQNGISPPVADSGPSVGSFSISAVRGGIVDIQANDLKTVKATAPDILQRFGLNYDDILMVRGNGNLSYVGKCGVVESPMADVIYPDILMRMRVSARVLAGYLVMLINSPMGRVQIENAAKTTVGTFKVNNQHVRQLWLPCPPITEQADILEKVREEFCSLNQVLVGASRETHLLQEYRTRLTSDVVTGKLDVRQAAANLPTDAEEDDALELDEESEEEEEVEDLEGVGV